jgi:adenylylsulfate kinase-like enzyme
MKPLNAPNYKLFWFTGQPGSGKTTLAQLLKWKLEMENTFKQEFESSGKKIVILDGDEIRELFNNSDYSKEGRMKNVEMVQNCCRFLVKNDIIVIVCMVSPFATQRSEIVKELNGCEIFVECIETRGREHFHVDYYQEPLYINNYPSITINTSFKSPNNSFEKLWKKLL